MARPLLAQPDELEALGDRSAADHCECRAAIANRMAQGNEDPRGVVPVRHIDRARHPRVKQIPVAFQGEIDQRVEKRVARRHQGRLRLAGDIAPCRNRYGDNAQARDRRVL